MAQLAYYFKIFFFSSFPKNLGLPNTQHRLYSHNTFVFHQMSQIPERSRSKTSTALTVSSTCFALDHLRRPPTIRLHSLLSFTHALASGMLSPLSLKQPFTPSIHLVYGLPLRLFPSTSARYIFFTNLSPTILSTCPNHRRTAASPLSLKLL